MINIGPTQRKILITLSLAGGPTTTNRVADVASLSKDATGNALRRLRIRKLVTVAGARGNEDLYTITQRGLRAIGVLEEHPPLPF